MGCSVSKLDDEEAVRLCKDRKRLIKEAIDHRAQFASAHDAYIQALRRVSSVLCDYIEGDKGEPSPARLSLSDSYTSPMKTSFPDLSPVSGKSFPSLPTKFKKPNSVLKACYLRSGGSAAVTVEEEPPDPPATVRMESYSPIRTFGVGEFFQMPPSSSVDHSFLSRNNRVTTPPPPPQISEWDYFWNPFTFLDDYSYVNSGTVSQDAMDYEINGLKQVREEEGIPDLEEEGATADESDASDKISVCEECSKAYHFTGSKEEILVEEENEEECRCDTDISHPECSPPGVQHEVRELKSHCSESVGVIGCSSADKFEVSNRGRTKRAKKADEASPDLVFSVSRRATSIREVFRLLKMQFNAACNSGNVVSAMLEATRAQYSSKSNELLAMKMLNPVALIRSASSRSSSSRFLFDSASSADESHESSSEFSEESHIISDSHQSALDRLFMWEKKLYDEVKAVERSRIAYERKCKKLHESDMKGKDPSTSDKLSFIMRDLHARLSVSIQSITSISSRIETLRDQELSPQLLELAQGLATMWSVMAECHRSQKQALDEAKHAPPKKPHKQAEDHLAMDDPQSLVRSIDRIETEVRNWRACLQCWITSQRSYMHALTGWLVRCMQCNAETSKLPCTPQSLPIVGICIQWSKFLDSLSDSIALDGLDFLASTVNSLREQQRGFAHVEDVVVSVEEMKEVATRVLCSGMSAAMASLLDFALSRARGYASLARQWEKKKSA